MYDQNLLFHYSPGITQYPIQKGPLGMSGPASHYRWERKNVSKVASLMGWDGTKASNHSSVFRLNSIYQTFIVNLLCAQ